MTFNEWVENYLVTHPGSDPELVRAIAGAAWVAAFGEGHDAGVENARWCR